MLEAKMLIDFILLDESFIVFSNFPSSGVILRPARVWGKCQFLIFVIRAGYNRQQKHLYIR